jgi:hypothetical protein
MLNPWGSDRRTKQTIPLHSKSGVSWAAEAATVLKADDANGGDGGVTGVGCALLAAGGGLIN